MPKICTCVLLPYVHNECYFKYLHIRFVLPATPWTCGTIDVYLCDIMVGINIGFY